MKWNDPGMAAAKRLFDEVVGSVRLGKLLFARFFNFSKTYPMPPPPHQRPKESRIVRYPVWTTAPDWLAPQWQSSYEWFLNSACHDVNLITYFFPEDVAAKSARVYVDSSVAAV